MAAEHANAVPDTDVSMAAMAQAAVAGDACEAETQVWAPPSPAIAASGPVAVACDSHSPSPPAHAVVMESEESQVQRAPENAAEGTVEAETHALAPPSPAIASPVAVAVAGVPPPPPQHSEVLDGAESQGQLAAAPEATAESRDPQAAVDAGTLEAESGAAAAPSPATTPSVPFADTELPHPPPPPPPPHAVVLESAESQVQRAAARQAAAEARVRDLRAAVGAQERIVEADSRTRDDAAAGVTAAMRRANAVLGERSATTSRVTANAADRARLVAAVEAAKKEKELLLAATAAGASIAAAVRRASADLDMTNAKLEQAQVELELVQAEGEMLEKTLGSLEPVLAAVWQVVRGAQQTLNAATARCAAARDVLKERESAAARAQVGADNVARVHALYKLNTTTTTAVAAAAAASSSDSVSDSSDHPVVVVRPRSLVQPCRRLPDQAAKDGAAASKASWTCQTPCPVCDRWFFCGDMVGASCGCTYHLHCAVLWFRQGEQKVCCRSECRQRMHPAWLAAWVHGWDADDQRAAAELRLEEQTRKWIFEERIVNSSSSSSSLSSSLGSGEGGGAVAAAEPPHSSAAAASSHNSASNRERDLRALLNLRSSKPLFDYSNPMVGRVQQTV